MIYIADESEIVRARTQAQDGRLISRIIIIPIIIVTLFPRESCFVSGTLVFFLMVSKL